MNKIIIIYFLFSLIFFSCKEENDKNIIASYKDEQLTSSEIKAMLPNGLSPEDSTKLVKEFIENWAINKIILETSREELDKNVLLEIEQKVENYKNDLLVDEIELQWLAQDSVTNPSEKELLDYYEKNKANFLAEDDFVEFRFAEVPSSKAYITRKLMQENTPRARIKLDTLMKNNLYKAEIKPQQWLKFSQLVQLTPLPDNAPKAIYLKKQIFNLPHQGNYFLLQITNFAKKGEPKPFVLVKNQIQSMLINKRKLNLLTDKKNKLYEKALYNDEIKIK